MAGLTARLGTRISPDADHRLRLLVMARRGKLGQVLSDWLESTLPPAGELAEQLKDGGRSGPAAEREDARR